MSKFNQSNYRSHNRYRGATLVELMVAMVISLVVLYAVGTVYITTKRTYSVQDVFSQMQESALFGFQFLTQDVSSAGFSGCSPYIKNMLDSTTANAGIYNFLGGVYGWEYKDTGPNKTYTINNPIAVASAGSKSDWQDNNSQPLDDTLAGKVVPGTDILVLKSAKEIPTLHPVADVDPNNVQITFPAKTGRQQGSVFIIADCVEADVFMNNDKPDDTTLSRGTNCGGIKPCNDTSMTWRPFKANDVRVYSTTARAYYIGIGTNNEPALFRINYANGVAAATPEELVDGVENMQILYGVDVNSIPGDADNGPSIPIRYETFDNVSNPAQIVSVRISLLMRSTDELSRTPPNNAPTYILAGVDGTTGTTVTLNNADSRLRKVFTTTISLRNMVVAGRQAYTP